ncbi:MAG: PD40 domain-containing protein [Acidobacteria bacterium]|nr:PD40 domain-containing protein [Acidobacteriota bacterium]
MLDFGLAKLTQAPGFGSQSPALTASPTMSVAFTGAGVILGTAAYMAPEQARGKVVDKRADVWAFGCVLFEMLTARRAFDGTDATEMIAAVVRGEPEWSALPAATSPGLRALLKRCLEKDPKRRIRDIGDVRFELEEIVRAPATPEPAAARESPARVPLWRRAAPMAAAVLVTAAVAGYVGRTLAPEPDRATTRFSVALARGDQFTFTGRHVVAISPAGTHLAYVANGRLYLHAMDQLGATPIRGVEGGRSPFFSADGQWIGFWQGGQLKKISITGGAPVVLCAADSPWGASWGADDVILFGQGPKGIMRVYGSGGTPEVLIAADEGQSVHGPVMLPGGRAVLFTLLAQGGNWDQAEIVVQSLDSGDRRVLVRGGRDARYVATGHLVYALETTLLAVPFDADALEVAGGPVPLVEDVANAAGITGAAHFALAADGTLVYVGGVAALARRTPAWVDRQGREEAIKAPPRAYRYPRLSPDGTRVALDLRDEQQDVWIWHLAGETLTRLTLDPANEQYGVWASNERIVFGSPRAGSATNLFMQSADGTGAAERLTESQRTQFPMAVSLDGSRLVFREDTGSGSTDLMMVSLDGERRPQPLVQTPFTEYNAEISPDGRWLAHESNESGRFEIYVRPFPNVNDRRWQVSTEGGTRPLWARSGRELFYITPAGDALMSMGIVSGPAFKVATPTKLLDTRAYYFPIGTGTGQGSPGRMYDVSPDGRRFLMLKAAADSTDAPPASITVVQNWTEELKRRVPIP